MTASTYKVVMAKTVGGRPFKIVGETEHYIAVEFEGVLTVSQAMVMFEGLRSYGWRPVQGSYNTIICEKAAA